MELNLYPIFIIRDLLQCIAFGGLLNVVKKNSIWLTHKDVIQLLLLGPHNESGDDKPTHLKLLDVVGYRN